MVNFKIVYLAQFSTDFSSLTLKSKLDCASFKTEKIYENLTKDFCSIPDQTPILFWTPSRDAKVSEQNVKLPVL